MKGLVVEQDGSLAVREMPMPAFNDCQALVKMRSCGVCNGTDGKIIHQKFKGVDQYPLVLGHEGVGEVVQVGGKVISYKVGDLVLLPFLEGMCGPYHSSWGAFAEYAVVGDCAAYIRNGMGPGTPQFSEGYYAQTVVAEKGKIDAVSASMIVTFREVLSAIRRFGMQPNQSVIIFGAGPVGLCFTRFCKLLGLGTVITVDISPEKVEAARNMGADHAFNSKACDVDAAVREVLPGGADFVVDAVGVSAILNQAMGLIADHGHICCYGISPNQSMNLDWSAAPYNWVLDFVQMPLKKEEADAHAQIMAWLDMGVLDPWDFISHVIPFADILDAFALVEQKKSDLKKIVVRF